MKKRFGVSAFFTVGLLAVQAANATVVQLDFDGLQNLEPINNYYDGGLGGFGSGPGPASGVVFTSSALALTRIDAGGSGNHLNNPSGANVLFFLDAAPVMNYASGFDTGFSFYYSLQTGFSSAITIYDGINGTGSVLGSFPLTSTPSPYSVFVPVGLAFSGTAKSVKFSGDANFVVFDNVTFGSEDPSVPEPTAMALLVPAAVGVIRRRRATVAQ